MKEEPDLQSLLKLFPFNTGEENEDPEWLRSMKEIFIWSDQCKDVDLWLQTISLSVDQRAADGKSPAHMDQLTWLIQKALDQYRTEQRVDYQTIFKIGALYGRFIQGMETRVSYGELWEFYKAYVAEAKRTLPLRKKQLSQKSLKRICQDEAKKQWANPESEHLRLGEMCQEVWSTIHKWLSDAERDFTAAHMQGEEDCRETVTLFRDALPERADGLKPWLREIAPKSATRKGRPIKK